MLQVLHLDVSKVDRTSSGGSDFQLCFWPPRQLVAAGRPRPSSSGQRQLEAALKRCLRAAWACEMAHEADCRRWRLDAPPVRTSSGLIWSSDAFRRFTIWSQYISQLGRNVIYRFVGLWTAKVIFLLLVALSFCLPFNHTHLSNLGTLWCLILRIIIIYIC